MHICAHVHKYANICPPIYAAHAHVCAHMHTYVRRFTHLLAEKCTPHTPNPHLQAIRRHENVPRTRATLIRKPKSVHRTYETLICRPKSVHRTHETLIRRPSAGRPPAVRRPSAGRLQQLRILPLPVRNTGFGFWLLFGWTIQILLVSLSLTHKQKLRPSKFTGNHRFE